MITLIDTSQMVATTTDHMEKRKTKSKRSIRFKPDDELCEFHTAGAVLDYPGANGSEIWYQFPDLQCIKRKAVIAAKECVFGSLLADTYGKTCSVTQNAVDSWVRKCGSCRGLERFINKEYGTKRMDGRRRAIKSVLRAQQKMKSENLESEYIMTVIRRLSEAFSRDARSFALVLGIADSTTATVQPPKLNRAISPNSVLDNLLSGNPHQTMAPYKLKRTGHHNDLQQYAEKK
jgi:hypothetical protein